MREAREAAQGTLRQTCKTASMVLAAAAERQRAERGQTQPAEDRQFTLAPVQASPRNLGEICPNGQILAPASFSLLDRARPVFSFSALRKRENGGCNEPAIIMAESTPPVRASKSPPARRAVTLRPAPVGRTPPSPRRAPPLPWKGRSTPCPI